MVVISNDCVYPARILLVLKIIVFIASLTELDASGDGQWAIDNIEFGYEVPLPPAFILFAFSLFSLVFFRKKPDC